MTEGICSYNYYLYPLRGSFLFECSALKEDTKMPCGTPLNYTKIIFSLGLSKISGALKYRHKR